MVSPISKFKSKLSGISLSLSIDSTKSSGVFSNLDNLDEESAESPSGESQFIEISFLK